MTLIFFISAGADIRNAVYKGTVNGRGFDGVFRFGARKEKIQVDLFYEIFKIIEYKSFGITLNYVLMPDKKLTPLLGIELGMIQRPKHLYPSLAALGELDYHFGPFFIYIKGEIKVRPDINDKIKGSVYGGLGYKFN
ncbi:hypothetical protein JM83_0289 [Gillisia sp. Hel_I_86]|uniref:hypothetical protein n=1 Tax=Gillisia sp. Hel_I_86 TaxID=1249981 RepID=UPI00119BE7D3|nr:hypothetical protein [Gillisia sp. Hel_I_86]TVZ25383.1 hypothetical protein JM83_0289 [Gillisia sp. Hel_I_86]